MVNENGAHIPVLFRQSLEGLNIKKNGIYIDGTFGRGGHSLAILKELGPDGRLMVVDQDHQAIEVANELFADENRVVICHGNFSQITEFVEQQGWTGMVDGVFLDLGVSSPQLDEKERGFSFRNAGPLDMRMDQSQSETAQSWLATASEQEMAKVFWMYGEERHSRKIARKIVQYRENKELTTTLQLADLVDSVMPNKHKMKKHPATRVFQAIRIHINRELEHIEKALDDIKKILKKGGRLAVISFHSLEDRIVKRRFQAWCSTPDMPRHLPIMGDIATDMKHISKQVKADAQELALNPRSRSAILRVVEKC